MHLELIETNGFSDWSTELLTSVVLSSVSLLRFVFTLLRFSNTLSPPFSIATFSDSLISRMAYRLLAHCTSQQLARTSRYHLFDCYSFSFDLYLVRMHQLVGTSLCGSVSNSLSPVSLPVINEIVSLNLLSYRFSSLFFSLLSTVSFSD